jgi:GT2 family glycosyltransferase
MDVVWAVPIERGHDVDVITASVADLPPGIDPPPVRRGDLGPRGEVPVPTGSETRLTWGEHSGQIVGWDPVSGAAIMLSTAPLNEYDLVSPLRTLVHWSTVAAGGVLVHGAVVGRRRRNSVVGLLLLGEAGYGKSTTTLGCVGHGWLTCGDDAVAVFAEQQGWHARAIYAAIKTKLAGAVPADLPEAGSGTVSWDIAGTKRAHLLTATDEQTLVPQVNLTAIVVLDPAANHDEPVSSASPATVRTLAAPSTVLPLPFDRQPMLDRIGELATALPGYRLPRRRSIATTVSDLETIAADSDPWVSVVIPVYNGQRFVADAVRSILDQTVGRFQIIVVNDASPDDSLAVAEHLREEVESCGHALDTLDLKQNQGIAGARNAGLQQAHGDYIAWLDQDDLWPPDRTALLWSALRGSGAQIAQGRMAFADLTPDSRRSWVRQEWFDSDHPGYVLGAVLCTRRALETVGVLDASHASGADDVDWFMRAKALDVPTAIVEHVAVTRRIHETNQSRLTEPSEFLAVVRAHLIRKRTLPS